MNYTNLITNESGKTSKVGIIGATRGFGYTLLAQIPTVKHMNLRVISSRNQEECLEVLKEIGYSENKIVICKNKSEIDAAAQDAILIISDYRLVVETDITALVECTGNTTVSTNIAVMALKKGINVYMVSKETDSVCGAMLNKIATENGTIYALINGDQPRNLLDLCSWAKLLGLEIIVAGKSSEYDFVWNSETGELTCTDGNDICEQLPQMLDHWHYEGIGTLEARKKMLEKYTKVVSADLCEMNLVSNVTGFTPATPFLNYPIAKISELAEIFIPEEDGGILKKKGVVDVFFNLRGIGEASFCGGEFIIIACTNDKMWDLLESKGHIVSKNGKYACVYYPYHLLGLETPVSILLGDLMGIGTQPECRQVTVLVGIAEIDLTKGTTFQVQGHHHEIKGLTPALVELKFAKNHAPFYLLNGSTLLKDIKAGQPISFDDVDLSHLETYKLYKEGLEL